MAAGDKKETLSLDPSDEAPGACTAAFIPTVQTTYSYRIFGTIHGSPVDLTFACAPGEVSEISEDNSQLRISGTITRIEKAGASAAPALEMRRLPEPALSAYELNQNTQALAAAARVAESQATTARTLSIVGVVAGILGLAVAGMAGKKGPGHEVRHCCPHLYDRCVWHRWNRSRLCRRPWRTAS